MGIPKTLAATAMWGQHPILEYPSINQSAGETKYVKP
jgi:hypothetical protein